MTGQLKMPCISSYSGHFPHLQLIIVRTQRFFRSFGQSVCLSTMPSFYSMINARFNERRTDANAEIFCPVMTKIKYLYTTTHACTQCPTCL